jgi:hypothetical protein
LIITLPPRPIYILLYLARIGLEARIRSKDLTTTFAGILKAYKSENLLEGAKYI